VDLFVDLRSRTTLTCGALALAIAISTLLRGRVRPVHLLFAAFAGDMGLWYLSQSLFGFFKEGIWERFTVLLAVLLPQFALHLFAGMVRDEGRGKSWILRYAWVPAVLMAALVLSPLERSIYARVLLFLYVFVLITLGLWDLGQRGTKSASRATQRRVRFLVVVGSLAGLASAADFAWFLGVDTPPIGAALSIVFLFQLAQALRHERLLDAYEMLGRLLVATAVAFLIAGIFYVLITIVGTYRTMYLNAVLAAIVVLVVFDPLRNRVEEQIQRLFFRERFDLERSLSEARRRLAHALTVGEMGSIVTTALELSRRVTASGIFLLDRDGAGFDRLTSLGERVPQRIEAATVRPLIDQLERGPVVMEEVRREALERRSRGERPAPKDALVASAEVLGVLENAVVISVRVEGGEMVGLFFIADDRVRDAFSVEEVGLLENVAAQMGVVVENSRLYALMKERDRLALLGQMAAGLAHEIRNPLGAIKGAAQLLAEPSPDGRVDDDPTSREFLGIILEEVERLDRVVGSVLDLARSSSGANLPVDVNSVVLRTVQVMSSERANRDADIVTNLGDDLPRVPIDPEQLRQVLMNLVHNAVQAMKGRGRVTLTTRARLGRGTRSGGGTDESAFVEIAVADNGPGMSQKILENIFMPFFTTKDHGTGLGLAISQRIVEGAGGRIEVRSYEGKGSTFAVILPAAAPVLGTPSPSPVAAVALGEVRESAGSAASMSDAAVVSRSA
jgi:two-component system sensor histidine kinase HydH